VYNMRQMASFFEYLQELFLTLFSPNPEEAEKRRSLRALHDRLRQMQPPCYRRSGNMLLPALGFSFLQLAYLLAPLAELFAKTIENEDTRLAERYREFLAVARLPEAQARLLPQFSLEAIRQKALTAASPMKELERIQKEFDQLMSAFSGPEFYSFDLDYTATERLAALARHNFTRLLSLFEPGFDLRQKQRKPQFQPVPGEKALKELLDVYFILAGIELSETVERNLFALLDRLEREHSEAGKERVHTIFGRLQKLVTLELAPEVLLTLIRVLRQDPKFTPETVKEEVAFLHTAQERLSFAFQHDQERVLWEINENAIGGDLKTLFSGAELLEVGGYMQALAQELADRDYQSFHRVKPLRILKSFLYSHFQKELKEPLKKLLIEGSFANRVFENMLTNASYNCEGLLARIERFEEELKSGQAATDKIRNFLRLHDQGKPVLPLVAKAVETIEQEARKLVDEGSASLYNLSVILDEALQDARQKIPALIINVRSIAGRTNKEYLLNLGSALGELQLFIRIMRNFSEIRQNPAAAVSHT
jgi:hypothetical protein